MDIKKLTKKPQIIELKIDNKEIVEQFGEAVTFYMKDYLDLSLYFEFYKLQESQNVDLLVDLLRKIVLDQDGNRVLADDEIFPVEITLAILNKVNDHLGKINDKSTVKKNTKE